MRLSSKVVVMIACTAFLSACELVHPEDPHYAEKMRHWGNYKCISRASSGETYMGWSVFENEAREHALLICEDREGNKESCTIDHCYNDVKEDHNKK